MATKSARIVFALFSFVAIAVPILADDWKPIPNPNAKPIVKIAKFALAQHNKGLQTILVFKSVVKGDTQPGDLGRTIYRLFIDAVNSPGPADEKVYTAIVEQGRDKRSLRLLSFIMP